MKPYQQRITKLLGEMTLDEKIAQLGSYWFYQLQKKGCLNDQLLKEKLHNGIGQITRIGGSSTYDPLKVAKSGNTIQKYLVEQTRLGIPAILHEESCVGAMVLGGTMFPEIVGLASSFQPELAGRMAEVIRKQLLAIGARQALAPVLDVCRDPRWGRTEETFGEDPTLISHFGVAYIKGLQTDHLADGVIATAKHFIGHSLSQGGMNCNPVHMGMRDVYDVYLGPFQAAIRDAGLASIMNAYPELDGEVVAASRAILTDLLRNELGFDGLVVSDYEAVLMVHNFHHMAATLSEAAVLSLNAGIEVELPETVCYGKPLKAALEAGKINLEVVDTAVQRHLKMKFELGLFEQPYVDEGLVLEIFDTKEQRQLAREIANRSMVLLKNDGILPLKKDIRTLAVIGPNADNASSQIGDYSYPKQRGLMIQNAQVDSCFENISEADKNNLGVELISVLQGIRKAANSDMHILYAKGCDNMSNDRSGLDAAVKTAKQADAVVLVLGDDSGLIPSCTTGEFRDSAELILPGLQRELAEAVLATGKPVALVMINGRPYAETALFEKANAVLEAWMPGEEGGCAVADTLFGSLNPGGKLPLTFPRHVGQVPIFYNHKPSGNRSHFYGDYVTLSVSPLFPFGHGLSYTTFQYSDLKINKKQADINETVEISVKVTNSGSLAGDEVVQLYICDEYASLPRPVKELKGYLRIQLKAGESKKVIFHLPVNQLAFYDLQQHLIVEAGKILVMVGSSSMDIRLNGEFEVRTSADNQIDQRVFVCDAEEKACV
jgi:beta-glucosidase